MSGKLKRRIRRMGPVGRLVVILAALLVQFGAMQADIKSMRSDVRELRQMVFDLARAEKKLTAGLEFGDARADNIGHGKTSAIRRRGQGTIKAASWGSASEPTF